MYLKGTVLLDQDPIGSFKLDEEERVVVTLDKIPSNKGGFRDLLDFATVNGMIVGLQFRPEYGSED